MSRRGGHPGPAVPVGHVEPAPMRVRAYLNGEKVLDTTRALYVWESLHYPQFHIPREDVRDDLLEREDATQATGRGSAELYTLRVGDAVRPHAVKLYSESSIEGVSGTMRFEWDALEAWYEEDERVFVHPRSPYVRVEALRSRQTLRIELEGVVLAESAAPVVLFETGLPPRRYLDRTDVRFEHLLPTDTVSSCPYKGTTSGYWSARIGEAVHRDVAWCYDFPRREVLPIAGLVAFYDERVDVVLDGERIPRPATPPT